jgi:hypothetical protein
MNPRLGVTGSYGILYRIGLHRQQADAKKITQSAYEVFLSRVGLQDSTNITLILVPTPAKAKESSIEFVRNLKTNKQLGKMTIPDLLSYVRVNGFNSTTIEKLKPEQIIKVFRESVSNSSTIT